MSMVAERVRGAHAEGRCRTAGLLAAERVSLPLTSHYGDCVDVPNDAHCPDPCVAGPGVANALQYCWRRNVQRQRVLQLRVLVDPDQRSNKQASSDKSEKDHAGFLDDRRHEWIHSLVYLLSGPCSVTG